MPDLPKQKDFRLVLKAITFAAATHRDHRRKDAEASPHINHPNALAEVLWHEGDVRDPVTIAAALLHDADHG
jgi:GTP diphosphokinase / guanosine-3',5'-bis(diphosphate) 3'-diphosphatase